MNYVQSFNLFGVDAKQIPCIPGSGAPTTATEAAIGCFYMDTSSETKDVYKCVNITDGVYTWELLSSHAKGGADINDDEIGTSAWSSKNTVDKLCPTFTESGSAVTCEPIEGYPLEVVS